MANDAFISYATENKQIADAVCAKLEERGVRCWIAPRDILPGSNYAGSIANAIDASRTMVLVFSSPANQSSHVKREAERAVHNGIPIVPFRIEDVEPSAELGYFLGGQHWLDAMTPPLEQHIFRLAEALKVLTGGQTPVPEPLADASKGGASLKPPTGHAAPSPPPKSPLLGNRTVIYSIIALVVIALLGGGLYASGLFTSSTTPSGSAISGSQTTLIGDSIVYANATAGVKFSYPQTWVVARDPTSSGNWSDRYYFIWPPQLTNDTQDMRALGFWKQPKELYTGNNDTAIAYNKIKDDIAATTANNANVTIVQNITSTTLGGMPAYTGVWSYTSPKNVPMIANHIWTVKGGDLYGIFYSSDPAHYPASMDHVNQTVQSFEFI